MGRMMARLLLRTVAAAPSSSSSPSPSDGQDASAPAPIVTPTQLVRRASA
jgi:hypothetical protein